MGATSAKTEKKKLNSTTHQTNFKAGAKKKHLFLEAMIDSTLDVMVAVDKDFQVLDFNAAAAATFSWTNEATIGRHCNQVLRCRNLNGMLLCGTSSCPLVRVLEQKQLLSNEELIVGKDEGEGYEVSVSLTEIDMGNGPGVVFSARDMTTLKVANYVRANFVSMVSHELRTPLNSVHGFVDLLLHGHMGKLTKNQQMYLGYTQEGVQQLVSIVEDILFMTRSDSGQFEIKREEVNFRVLARQVIMSLQPQAKRAEVILDKKISSPSPIIYVDPQRMKQVLNNLVINAIKFTPPGGTVTIQARPYNEHAVMILVKDTGVGIAPEDQPHIFERFYQSNSNQQSKLGGYGLGLAIAKLIVEQHDSEIKFTTVPNQGTTFYFLASLYTAKKT